MFPLTKIDLIEKLTEFSRNKVVNYSIDRNFDYGVPHENVSKISPHLRRRFVNEETILKIIFKNNELSKVYKFVEEIFWRTYWKGWLETHPSVYLNYKKYASDNFIPQKTGIKCFDHWKEELIETGYLHNHARMWFASIWIFTLGYSWQSGANFFKNNLIDYCPATNTLSWRWVAGLQTIGKFYLARSDNIKFYTNNRFNPEGQLNEKLDISQVKSSNVKASDVKYLNEVSYKSLNNLGIILNNNDLSLYEVFDKMNLVYECSLYIKRNKNNLINKFENHLYNDIISRKKDIVIIKGLDNILEWIQDRNIKNLIIPYESIGNDIFNNNNFLKKIHFLEVNYHFHCRKWDKNAFPFSKKGFFNFKKNIPYLIKNADI